jgi:hypothetical protein
MTYEEEWVAIAARIAALKDAAQLRAQQATTQDSFGIGPMLGNESAAIVDSLRTFTATHAVTLPDGAMKALRRFFKERPVMGLTDNPIDPEASRVGVIALLLIAGELTHLLGARQERLRLRSAQAFEHL